MRFLEELISLSERLGVVNSDEAVGCTAEEIQILEDTLKIKLPTTYKEFLLWIGKSQISFMDGSQWRYYKNELILLQGEVQEILDEKNYPRELPKDVYVFFVHLDYLFFFFSLKEGDNPPVNMFLEGETVSEFRTEFCSFTDFLEYQILAYYLIINNSVQENLPLLRGFYRPCHSNIDQ